MCDLGQGPKFGWPWDSNIDDSNVTMDVLLKSIAGRNIPEGFILTEEEGGISSNTNAEGLDKDNVTIIQGVGSNMKDD